MLVQLKGNFIRSSLIRFMVARDASTGAVSFKAGTSINAKRKKRLSLSLEISSINYRAGVKERFASTDLPLRTGAADKRERKRERKILLRTTQLEKYELDGTSYISLRVSLMVVASPITRLCLILKTVTRSLSLYVQTRNRRTERRCSSGLAVKSRGTKLLSEGMRCK